MTIGVRPKTSYPLPTCCDLSHLGEPELGKDKLASRESNAAAGKSCSVRLSGASSRAHPAGESEIPLSGLGSMGPLSLAQRRRRKSSQRKKRSSQTTSIYALVKPQAALGSIRWIKLQQTARHMRNRDYR